MVTHFFEVQDAKMASQRSSTLYAGIFDYCRSLGWADVAVVIAFVVDGALWRDDTDIWVVK